jgi:hypothetical protein
MEPEGSVPNSQEYENMKKEASLPHPVLSTPRPLGLPSGLSPSGFPTNNLYEFLFSPIRATWPAHLILHDLIILIIEDNASD